MKLKVHNRKLNDELDITCDDDEEVVWEIKNIIHNYGWEDKDCWSEIVEE